MGHLIKLSIVCLIVLTSCDYFEPQGFVTSQTNVNERFEASLAWNKANGYETLHSPRENYSIYAMGDSHIGSTDNLNYYLQQASARGALAQVMVGDITTGHQDDILTLSELLPSADSLNSFAIVGNHDLYFDGWQSFFELLGSSSYYFIVKTPSESDLFICLDTGGGTLGAQQYEWLEALLKSERTEYRHCVIFTHNNFYRLRSTTSTNPMSEETQALSELFLRHEVNMVVTGHDHQRDTEVYGHTTHIIMDALQDHNDDASYLTLDIDLQDLSYTFVEL